GLVGVGLHLPAVAAARQRQFGTARFFRIQLRVAGAGEVQFVEAGRLERGGVAGGDAPAAGEVHAPGDPAGGVAAELVVVVATQAQLQALRAELALVLRERGAVAATDGERRPRVDHVGGVAQPVEAGAQQLALGHAEVALQARAVAGGAVAVGEAAADVVVGIVGIAAGGQLQLHGVGRRPAHAAADDLLDDVGIVLVVAVVVVVAFGAERLR